MLRNKLICYQYLFKMDTVLIQTNYLAKSTSKTKLILSPLNK